MRTILHLSDLHFGRTDPDLVEPLLQAARAIAPDLVVVSGDLTQRARRGQFLEARLFLDRLPGPQLVVPGNHDIPLDRVLTRLVAPLRDYRRWIDAELEPAYVDDELAVYGLSSAHGLTVQGGRINSASISRACRWLRAAPPGAARVVVMHHPPVLPPGGRADKALSSARRRLAMLADCGTEAVLSGHLHTSWTELAAHEDHLADRSVLLIQAGTGLSTRRRGESNGFNTVQINDQSIDVTHFAWQIDGSRFEPVTQQKFVRSAQGPVAG